MTLNVSFKLIEIHLLKWSEYKLALQSSTNYADDNVIMTEPLKLGIGQLL